MITDLSTYTRSSDFYTPKAFLLTVKSFDLKKIRERYLKSRRSKSGRIGSVERREVTRGGLVYVEIEKGYISAYEMISFLTEPRGIDIAKDMIALSTENVVHIVTPGSIERIDDPWFSYIHTVKFNHCHESDRLLISSSGFDCIFEYDLGSYERTWEWYAWEHGFNKGYNPVTGKEILLTRSSEEASYFRTTQKDHIYINDPVNQTLPTAQRAAFINSVVYDCKKRDKLLATFFHEGSVYHIDMKTGQTEIVFKGMKSPHGGRNYRDGYMATSTATGEVLLGDGRIISFKDLPGKAEELGDLEWLQNSAPFDDCIITIDANRNSFLLIDPDHKRYDMIRFDPNWAIQDIAEIRDTETKDLVKKLKEKL